MEWLRLLLEAVPVVFASGTAIWGIHAWRREHIGRRRIDLAEEVLALFYEARAAVRHVRCPLSYSSESAAREHLDNETEQERRVRDLAYVPVARYAGHKETFSRLRALRWRFMAHFGKASGEPFETMHRVMGEILNAARMAADVWLRRERGFVQEGERSALADLEGRFWEGRCDPDPIMPRVDCIIKQIEQVCSRVLKPV